MAYKLGNRVRMTVTGTPGTGTISLGSAVAGFNDFGSALSTGDTCPYVIDDNNNAWEIGVGTYTSSGTTLARTTVVASSAGGTTKISATSSAVVYLAPLANDLNAATYSGIIKANGAGVFSAAVAGTDYLAPSAVGATVQAYDADLDAIAAISGTSGLLKKTAANTWALDTSTYLTTVTKSDIGLGNVENTALSTWAGSANITTLGTIATGTWGATTIAVNKGGTGATTLTGIIKGNGTSAFTAATANTDYLVAALATAAVSGSNTATFNSQTTIATTTGSITVDWTSAQNQKQTEPTGSITYTFTAPPGPCHLQLLIDSDGTSTAQTFTWPGTVIWLSSTWAAAANKKAIINFWYDGTNYYAMGANQV